MSTEYRHLVLTENSADKMEYKRMISLAVEKILASLDSGDAYKGLTPEKLRERVHTDELLPENGLGFDAVMEEYVAVLNDDSVFDSVKGELESLIKGAEKLDSLDDGDTVLISEGCTHHRQCGDIGTVKMPAWIKKHSGKELNFAFTSGGEFPEDLSQFALVVHCGGCMLNEREMKTRQENAFKKGVPMVNYGMAIAHMNGILKRSLQVFK